MLEQLRKEMEEKRLDIERLRKLGSELSSTRNELYALQLKVRTYESELAREEREREREGRTGLAGLFARIAGIFSEEVVERVDAALVARQCDQGRRDIESVEERIAALKSEQERLAGAPKEYDELVVKKRKALVVRGGETGLRLWAIAEAIAGSEIRVKELEGTIEMGREVVYALGDASYSLEGAGKWGTFDIFAGGMVSSLIKHHHINKANDSTDRAMGLFHRFKRRLPDGRLADDMRVETMGLLGITDVIFDNIISDLFMQRKIINSQNNVDISSGHVMEILDKLKKLKYDEECLQRKLRDEERRLIESA